MILNTLRTRTLGLTYVLSRVLAWLGLVLIPSWILSAATFGIVYFLFPIPFSFSWVGLLLSFGLWCGLLSWKVRVEDFRLPHALGAGFGVALFFDRHLGGWNASGGGDSGNHWMLIWDIVSGDHSAYSGFTAYHWMVLGAKQLFGALGFQISAIQLVAFVLSLSMASGLLFWQQIFLPQNEGRAPKRKWFISFLALLVTVAVYRALVGCGFYSQLLSWVSLSFFLVALRRRDLFLAQVLLLALRGVYGGELPFLAFGMSALLALQILEANGFWRRWWQLSAAGWLILGVVGCGLLFPIQIHGGGFLDFGLNEAFIGVFVTLGFSVFYLFNFFKKTRGHFFAQLTRRDPLEVFGWVMWVVLPVFILAVALYTGPRGYYYKKTLLLAAFFGWVFPAAFVRRVSLWGVFGATLIFQRYVVLTLYWALSGWGPQFVLPMQKTTALIDRGTEQWLLGEIQSRQCSTYAYFGSDASRSNWANHFYFRNREIPADWTQLLATRQELGSRLPDRCIFVETTAATYPTHGKCFTSTVRQIGTVCAVD